MTLVLQNPWRLTGSWRNQPHRTPGSGEAVEKTWRNPADWRPPVDIREQTDRYLLHADIPGVRPDDIEVSMEKGILTIKGERSMEPLTGSGNLRRAERPGGTFNLRFGIPEDADPDRVSATGRDGVLEVSIPKLEAMQPRRIEIRH